MAVLLPTPQAHDATGGKTPEQVRDMRERTGAGVSNLNEVIPALLPTPVTSYSQRTPEAWRAGRPAGNGQVRDQIGDLEIVAKELDLLKTPTAQLAVNGGSQPPDKRIAGGHGPTLADQVEHLLPTPRAEERMQYNSRDSYVALSLWAKRLAPEDQVVDWGKYARAVLRWQQVTGRMVPAPLEEGTRQGGRLSAAFVEWMMGLPGGWVTDVPGLVRKDHIKMLGNGVVTQQARMALRILLRRAA